MLTLGLGVGGVTLVLAGVGAWTLWPRPHAAGRRALSAEDEELVRALADVYLAEHDGLRAVGADIVGGVDEYVAILPAAEGRLLRALFRAVDQLPRLKLASRARFTALPLAERVALLARLERGGRAERELTLLLRLLVGTALFRDARAFSALGISWGCPVIP